MCDLFHLAGIEAIHAGPPASAALRTTGLVTMEPCGAQLPDDPEHRAIGAGKAAPEVRDRQGKRREQGKHHHRCLTRLQEKEEHFDVRYPVIGALQKGYDLGDRQSEPGDIEEKEKEQIFECRQKISRPAARNPGFASVLGQNMASQASHPLDNRECHVNGANQSVSFFFNALLQTSHRPSSLTSIALKKKRRFFAANDGRG